VEQAVHDEQGSKVEQKLQTEIYFFCFWRTPARTDVNEQAATSNIDLIA